MLFIFKIVASMHNFNTKNFHAGIINLNRASTIKPDSVFFALSFLLANIRIHNLFSNLHLSTDRSYSGTLFLLLCRTQQAYLNIGNRTS